MKINTNYQLNKLPQSRPHFGDSYMNTDEIAEVINDADTTRAALRAEEPLKRLSNDVDTLVIPNYDGTVIVRVQNVTPHIRENQSPTWNTIKQAWRAIKMHYFASNPQQRTIPADHLLDRRLLETVLDLKNELWRSTAKPIEAAARLAWRGTVC